MENRMVVTSATKTCANQKRLLSCLRGSAAPLEVLDDGKADEATVAPQAASALPLERDPGPGGRRVSQAALRLGEGVERGLGLMAPGRGA